MATKAEKAAKLRARAVHDLQMQVRQQAEALQNLLADLHGQPRELARAMAAVRFAAQAQAWALAVGAEIVLALVHRPASDMDSLDAQEEA